MLFYRIIGALVLILSGVGGAYCMNQAATVSLAQIEGWIAFLRYVRVQIECFALPLNDILRKCDPTLLASCGYEGKSPPETAEALLEGISIRDGAAESILRGFFDEFGKGYREEQVRSCEYHGALLLERRETLSARLPERKKLHSTLCVAGALAVVVLLL